MPVFDGRPRNIRRCSMSWKKASPALCKLLDESMSGIRSDRRMMFGSPTFFLNGNMFAGVHEDNIILRLSEKDRKALVAACRDAKPFEPMAGRAMKEYMALPEGACASPDLLHDYLKRSYDYAFSLPAKKAKAGGKKRG